MWPYHVMEWMIEKYTTIGCLQIEITLFSQLVFVFYFSVCIGAYATFSVISRSTVVDSINVSYTGPGCVGWLDSGPVLSSDALDDRLYLQNKQMHTTITKLRVNKATTKIIMMM